MLSRRRPDRIRVAFDNHRLIANAGPMLPATLTLASSQGKPSLTTRC